MVDFGLVACFLVCLGMVAAAFVAWWGVKAELKGISSLKDSFAVEIAGLRSASEEAVRIAHEALTAVQVVDQAPKALQKRIGEVEALAVATEKKCDHLADKITSCNARISAAQRWRKGEADPMTETVPDEPAEGVQLMFPEVPPIPASVAPQRVPPGFGRKVA